VKFQTPKLLAALAAVPLAASIMLLGGNVAYAADSSGGHQSTLPPCPTSWPKGAGLGPACKRVPPKFFLPTCQTDPYQSGCRVPAARRERVGG